MSQSGLLIIADITGYSTYVKQSELEHARDSLTDLLNLLIAHTRPPGHQRPGARLTQTHKHSVS